MRGEIIMEISKLYPFECIKIENDKKKVMELFKIMKEDGEKAYPQRTRYQW